MYRFFKCNVLGGFRLTDLNRNIRQGEYFYIDSSFCDSSRATKVALDNKWMTEVSEKEASQFIAISKQVSSGGVQVTEVRPKRASRGVNQVATPDPKEANKKLESKQAERTIRKQPAQRQKEEDKPVVPNFNEAERAMRARQADVTTKGPDEVLKSPVEAKKEEEKSVVQVTKDDTVKDLANEISDNSTLSTPNFDEKKEEIKAEVSQEIEKRVRRRRRSVEPTAELVTSESGAN
jgi:hypothetical protein